MVVVVVVVVDVVLVVVVFDISVHQLQVVGHKVGFLNSGQVEQPSAPASAILLKKCKLLNIQIVRHFYVLKSTWQHLGSLAESATAPSVLPRWHGLAGAHSAARACKKHILENLSNHILHTAIPEGWIEKLLPRIANMDNQASTEEQMLQPEAGGHPSVVEQHLVLAVLLKAGLLGRGLSKSVCITLPSLVLGVFGVN